MTTLIKTFIVGSSWLIFAPFFHTFYNYRTQYNRENCINKILEIDPYYFYSLATPLYFGVMSVIGMLLTNYFQWNIHLIFGIVGLISALGISIAITHCNLYTFSKQRLYQQYIGLLTYHSLFFAIIIPTLIKFVEFY